MKITIEIESKMIADLVCNAIKDVAYKYELKREEFKEAWERTASIDMDERRKDHRKRYYVRKGAEAKVISDTLWELAMSIGRQAAAGEEEMENG